MTGAAPARKTPTSNALFVATLKWGGLVTAALIVIGAVVGYLIAGSEGMWSALAGVLLSAVFLAITAISILIANRWFGDALYVPIFFGIVLGGWILKFVVFLIILFVIRDQPWLNGPIFFFGLVASILGGLAVDVIAMLRIRMPYMSDLTLPGEGEPGADEPAAEEPDAGGPASTRVTDS